ncbi:type I restriction enzyme HsdR N-terminal domain-containing protein [Thiohalocapsa sp. ML1]|jgi:hypothetical protein|uniref:type I restriction enzyme HsdR N-terminal domain-containing protein n=1 Tax=Thiohalocapsa sp. ML1 TaxID=1431688 RepID=UPI0012E34365|nr:type I restriction enzyme HsdR N-terminal domain-containing protein [Thiohalocapsa sp. ML1]
MTGETIANKGDVGAWQRLAELDPQTLGPREEDVKFKFVAPLLRILGFEDTDCTFETPADLGRIDISIAGLRAAIIIECKAPRVQLEGYINQLEKYVRETMTRQHAAMIAVLTNGERLLVFGVLEAIHKNELSDHFLFEISRKQLEDEDTQVRLGELIGRDAINDVDIRDRVEALLRENNAKREQLEKDTARRSALLTEKQELLRRLAEIESELDNLTQSHRSLSPPATNVQPARKAASSFKWSQEYGKTEVVSSWLDEVLEDLLPHGSQNQVSHAQLTQQFSGFLEGRGSERAKSLSQAERRSQAGNMIDWITARWTAGLGGKDSAQMQSDPGAEVTDPRAKGWLREFTRKWARDQGNTWSFRRRHMPN